jgi:hypothetical protein
MPKKSVGKTNRRKGHNAERYYANFFKDLGYTFCKTARQASRLHDDCGIDLMYLPFLVQIKAGKQRGLKRADTLQYIEDRVKENFPPENPEHTMPKLLIERKDPGKGKKRTQYHDTVMMTVEDFIKLIKIFKNDTQIK